MGYEVGADYRVDRAEPLIGYVQWDGKRLGQTSEKAREGKAEPIPPAKVLSLLQAQISSILTEPPTEEEVARARNVAIGRDALRHERARDRAFLPGWYECVGVGYAFDSRLPELLQKVSREDILRVARLRFAQRLSALSVGF